MMKLYNVKEMTEYFNTSKNTIYQLIKEDKLKSKKVGRAYKITQVALDKFISNLSE